MGIDYSRINYLLDEASRDSRRIEDLVSAMVHAGVELPSEAMRPEGRLEFMQQAREFYKDFLLTQAKQKDKQALGHLIYQMLRYDDEIVRKSKRLRSVMRGQHLDAYTRSDFISSVIRRAISHYDDGKLQLKTLNELWGFILKSADHLVSEKGRKVSRRAKHEDAVRDKQRFDRRAAATTGESMEALFHRLRDSVAHPGAQELLTEMAVRWRCDEEMKKEARYGMPYGKIAHLRNEYIRPASEKGGIGRPK